MNSETGVAGLKYLFKASFFSDSYIQHFHMLYTNLLRENQQVHVKLDIEQPHIAKMA